MRWLDAERRDRLAHLRLEARHVEPQGFAKVRHGAVVHEAAGRDADDPDGHAPEPPIRDPATGQRLEDGGAEPARVRRSPRT